jgi:hypothetical protein
MAVVRFCAAILLLSAMLFLPACTLVYPEAWTYLFMFVIVMLAVGTHLIKNDPALLARRMRMREKEAEQKLIIKLSYIPFVVAFLLPGFDKRFYWSRCPSVWLASRIFWYSCFE